MKEQTLKSDELEVLAKKLDHMAEGLSEAERAVLLGVFGAASARMRDELKAAAAREGKAVESYQVDVSAPGTNLPPLSEGFLDTFAPKAVGRFDIDGKSKATDSIEVGVGGLCVSVSWGKEYNE